MILLSSVASAEAELYGGLTLEQWQERLSEINPADPRSAAYVPAMIEVIGDEGIPSDVRRPFAVMLGRMGPFAREAVPLLAGQIERRHEVDEPTYAWAARALALMGTHARAAAPVLVELLFDEEIPDGDRTLSVEALARIGPTHPAVMPALIRLLQYRGLDPSQVSATRAAHFRELAAEALTLIGPDADMAAPLLIRAVRNRDESESVRRKSIVALGAMRGRAALAVPALLEVLEFERPIALRMAAGEALGDIGEGALPFLQRYLQHSDATVRRYAAQAIGRMGKQAQPALSVLVTALQDEDPEVRIAICESLVSCDADPALYMLTLINLLASERRQVRVSAMRLLTELGPRTQPYWPEIHALEASSSAAVRAVVRKTLEALDAPAPTERAP
jgi:HEAT repeat protein